MRHDQINPDGKAFNGNYAIGVVVPILAVSLLAILVLGWWTIPAAFGAIAVVMAYNYGSGNRSDAP